MQGERPASGRRHAVALLGTAAAGQLRRPVPATAAAEIPPATAAGAQGTGVHPTMAAAALGSASSTCVKPTTPTAAAASAGR